MSSVDKLFKQVQKGIKAKKPTKTSLTGIDFVTRAVQKLDAMSTSAISKKLSR